jgi:hypothetical protein
MYAVRVVTQETIHSARVDAPACSKGSLPCWCLCVSQGGSHQKELYNLIDTASGVTVEGTLFLEVREHLSTSVH